MLDLRVTPWKLTVIFRANQLDEMITRLVERDSWKSSGEADERVMQFLFESREGAEQAKERISESLGNLIVIGFSIKNYNDCYTEPDDQDQDENQEPARRCIRTRELPLNADDEPTTIQ